MAQVPLWMDVVDMVVSPDAMITTTDLIVAAVEVMATDLEASLAVIVSR